MRVVAAFVFESDVDRRVAQHVVDHDHGALGGPVPRSRRDFGRLVQRKAVRVDEKPEVFLDQRQRVRGQTLSFQLPSLRLLRIVPVRGGRRNPCQEPSRNRTRSRFGGTESDLSRRRGPQNGAETDHDRGGRRFRNRKDDALPGPRPDLRRATGSRRSASTTTIPSTARSVRPSA